jgi:hypothetical protein
MVLTRLLLKVADFLTGPKQKERLLLKHSSICDRANEVVRIDELCQPHL